MKSILFLGLFLFAGTTQASILVSPEAEHITRSEDQRVRSEIENKIRLLQHTQCFGVAGEATLNEFIEWLKAQYDVGQDLEDLRIYGEVVFISYCNADILQYSEAMAKVSKIIVSHSARVACLATPETIIFSEGCFLLGRALGEVGGKYVGMQIYPFVKGTLCQNP